MNQPRVENCWLLGSGIPFSILNNTCWGLLFVTSIAIPPLDTGSLWDRFLQSAKLLVLSLTPQIAVYCFFTRVCLSYCLLRVINKVICSYPLNRHICNYCMHFASPTMIWQRCAMHCRSVPAFCAAAHWAPWDGFCAATKTLLFQSPNQEKLKGRLKPCQGQFHISV